MSSIKRFWLVAIVLAVFIPASAQLKFGPRVGLAVNSLHFNKEIIDKNNRAGFTAGLQLEFTVPLIGIGGDISAMYVRRNSEWMSGNVSQEAKKDYIEIPLNFKYKLTLPAISSIVCPYVFTGPDFAFQVSKRLPSDVVSKKCDIGWNFGFGVELIKHLQISASYGLGLTKALEITKIHTNNADIEGKNRYWTVTAAWLF